MVLAGGPVVVGSWDGEVADVVVEGASLSSSRVSGVVVEITSSLPAGGAVVAAMVISVISVGLGSAVSDAQATRSVGATRSTAARRFLLSLRSGPS